MKVRLQLRISLQIAMVMLFVATSNSQNRDVNQWSAALNSPNLFVPNQGDSVDKGAPQSILLVGENHASVKTQLQLKELLEALYRDRSVDAILVEGSNGQIDATDLRGRLPNSKATEDFWQGQLELGQIAGYEYIALTRDGVKAWGIEDMDAKRIYMTDAARRGVLMSLQEQIDLHKRALQLAKDAIAGVDSGARLRSGVDAVLTGYETKIGKFDDLTKKSGSEYAEAEASYTDAIERITELYSRLQSVLPAYNQVASAVQPYNKLVDQAKKMQAAGSLSSDSGAAKLLSDLQALKVRVEKASANFEVVSKKAGYADAEAVVADLKQVQKTEDSLKPAEEKLLRFGASFRTLESELTNQLFLSANAARTALGKPVPSLQTFLHDEAEKNANDPEKPYLSDRDKYMVSNTMNYLRVNQSAKKVVLIIGYAHLDGMSKRLAVENVNVTAGKIAASEEPTEAWENRAWERRSRPIAQVFSHTVRKERSRLQDDTYKAEIPALLAKLQTIEANKSVGIALGKTKIFEVSNGTTGRKAVVTTSASDLKSDWGDHVVQMGAMPDGKGTAYLVFDRDQGRNQVKALSGPNTEYATLYRTKGPQGWLTKLDTATGTVNLETFRKEIPRSGEGIPERVVIAPEGDGKVLHATLTAAGAGGGEPPWTSRRTLFEEPPERKRPSLFFTKNMRAANERLNAMDKQDPLKIGQIAVIELGFKTDKTSDGLDDLWFTPETGEHARAYFIIGDNTPEFRQRLQDAGDAGLLRNKQIALATCFDENESAALNDILLEAGALMVWSPQKRVSPEAAKKLQGYMEKVDTVSAEQPVKGLDRYMDRTLRLWHDDAQDDPDLRQFLDAVNTARIEFRSKTPQQPAD